MLTLGDATLIFSVKDLQVSIRFYTKLGFVHHQEESWNENFAMLRYGALRLSLMQGVVPQDMLLHFISGEQTEVDNAMSLLRDRGLELQPAGPDNVGGFIEDPDGNAIYLSIP